VSAITTIGLEFEDAELPLFELPASLSPAGEPPPSPEEVERARTPGGDWTKQQLAQWGVPWPPPRVGVETWRSASRRHAVLESGRLRGWTVLVSCSPPAG